MAKTHWSTRRFAGIVFLFGLLLISSLLASPLLRTRAAGWVSARGAFVTILPAKIEPAAEGSIASEYAARVSKVHVTNGAVVQAGDAIVTLENPEIGMQVTAAESRVAIATAKLRDARTREQMAREGGAEQERAAATRARDAAKERMDAFTLEPLRSGSERASKRATELAGLASRGLATTVELDSARTAAEAAGRDLSAAQEHLSRLRQELADSEDRVRLDRSVALPGKVEVSATMADLEDAQNTLAIAKERAGRLLVVAPVNGTVIGLGLRPGDTVQSGAIFARVADLAYLALSAPLTAVVARDVRPGTPVLVRLPVEPRRQIHAVVDGISLAPNPAQRAYLIRVVIPNPERSAVLVGLEAEIEFFSLRETMKTSVLLTTDGTYPCYAGGVSVWCDQLIRQLGEVDFHIFAIGYSPSHVPLFAQPPNVVSQQVCNLWGAEQPGVREESFTAALLRRLNTSPRAIRNGFLDAFRECIRAILEPEKSSEALADALMRMHRFFGEHDYARTMSSEEVWDAYLSVCRDAQPRSEGFSIEDATICMRWLARYLSVLAVTYPVTDVVHTSMSGLAGIPGVLQKKAKGSTYVVTEHGIFLRELYVRLSAMEASLHCRRFLFSFYEAVARMNYHFADEVTSLCEFNRKWQIRMGADPERIRITPNGVDPAVFTPPSPADAGLADDRPVVLTMARIYPLKGIDVLLEAARLVQDQMPNVRWRILGDVGDRVYYDRCLKLAETLGISANIEWGRTDNPAVEYRKADLFCLSSISEAMPYCVLEAMFSACPVVATDVGGVSEMLAGTGEIVTPRDPQALAAAILRVLSPEGRARRQTLVSNAFDRARALYTIEKCSDRFREIYGELADATRIAALSAAG